MHKIHIAIIVNSLPPYRINQHLKIAGMNVVQLSTIRMEERTRNRWDPLVPAAVAPVDMTGKEVSGLRGFLTGVQVVRLMKQKKIDLVIVNGYAKLTYVTVLVGCRLTGIPCCLFGDSNVYGDTKTGLKAFAKKMVLSGLFKFPRICLPCGTAGKLYFVKYGVCKSKVSLFPYEPNCDAIISLPHNFIADVLNKYCLSSGRKRIVFSGRLIDKKRPDIALDAFFEIAEIFTDWDLVFVGDGILKKSLISKVPVHYGKRINFTGFLSDQNEVSAIYRASDILILPSDYEPWALVIHEAVAAGMAVVASDVVGAAIDLVEEGKNGFRCPVGDVLAFSEALEKCITNIEEFKEASLKINEAWMRSNSTVPSVRRLLTKLGLSTDEN
jgi:glycosyltransferase involved in cell wall biosynthesis